jgi:hypothetical protein
VKRFRHLPIWLAQAVTTKPPRYAEIPYLPHELPDRLVGERFVPGPVGQHTAAVFDARHKRILFSYGVHYVEGVQQQGRARL